MVGWVWWGEEGSLFHGVFPLQLVKSLGGMGMEQMMTLHLKFFPLKHAYVMYLVRDNG